MTTDTDKLPTFVLRPPTDFWWPVRIPTASEGEYTYAKLDLLFAALPQPELDKMQGIGLAEGERAPTDTEIALRAVRGWRHMPDEHGNPVPFSEQALHQLLMGCFRLLRNLHTQAQREQRVDGIARRKVQRQLEPS